MFHFEKITTVLYHKKHKDNLTLVLNTVTKGDAQLSILK